MTIRFSAGFPSPGHIARLAVAWLMLVVALGAGVTAARAHAAFLGAVPADGAMLARAPERFELRFSEPVSPLALGLVAPDGTAIALDGARLEGSTLVVDAPTGLDRGSYALSWRVASEDGHPVAGAVVFSVGAASAGPGPALATTDPMVRLLVWLSRFALAATLFVGVGGVVHAAAIGPLEGRARRAVRAALALTLPASALALGAQGLDALGEPLAALSDPAPWQAALATSFARTAALAVAASLAGFLALSLTPKAGRIALAGAALVLAALAVAASGHAASAPPRWLTRPAVALHACAIALWIGALLPLAAALRRDAAGGTAALRRFSLAIPFVLAVLVATGLVLAAIQLGSPEALWQTAYGRVLLAKLAALALLFALAAANRWRLTRRVFAGERAARQWMARIVAAELVLMAVVLGLAGLWRFTPPPRVLVAIAAEPATTHAMNARAMADLTLTPGRAGPVRVQIVAMTPDYGPLDAKQVSVVFAQPAAGIEAIRRPAVHGGATLWTADAVLPVPGRWTVRVEILVDDFTLERLEGEVTLRP